METPSAAQLMQTGLPGSPAELVSRRSKSAQMQYKFEVDARLTASAEAVTCSTRVQACLGVRCTSTVRGRSHLGECC